MLELINVSYRTSDGKEIVKGVNLVINDRLRWVPLRQRSGR